MRGPLLVYGAYGYTGALIARRAVERGLSPVLAGRDSERLAALGRALGCAWRAFPLSDPEALRRGIEDAGAVLHCAGPFVRTFRPMAEACLETRVHYLDLTGEPTVLHGLAEMGLHAERAGVMLLPAAGFDVVPTDCLAVHLAGRLPGARRLVLAVQGLDRISRGTARTLLLHPEPATAGSGPRTRVFDLGSGPLAGVSVPWGDTFTAPRSTSIHDVTVYLVGPRASRAFFRTVPYLAPLLRMEAVRDGLARLLAGAEGGPDEAARARGATVVYGEAIDGDGRRVTARQRGPEAYAFTAVAAIEIAERVLRGEVRPGWQTPATAFGPDLVLSLPGVVREDLE